MAKVIEYYRDINSTENPIASDAGVYKIIYVWKALDLTDEDPRDSWELFMRKLHRNEDNPLVIPHKPPHIEYCDESIDCDD